MSELVLRQEAADHSDCERPKISNYKQNLLQLSQNVTLARNNQVNLRIETLKKFPKNGFPRQEEMPIFEIGPN